MWITNDILETEKVTVNFKTESITWKPNQFNPKEQIKFRAIIEGAKKGNPVHLSDFQ